MLIEQYLESVKLRFKWRRLICAAVKDARAEMFAKKDRAEGRPKNKKTDPTGNAAVKNISGIKSVRIIPRRGGKPVFVQDPEKWLAIIDAVYAEYKTKMDLLESLKRKRKVALRMGTLKDNGKWLLRPRVVKDLLDGKTQFSDLDADDVYLDIRQKGIDMKIGVDIASLALKRFVDTIVLFSGDSDFVPAAKLARREGIDFILDPMRANVEPLLFEHIDGIKSVTPTRRMKESR